MKRVLIKNEQKEKVSAIKENCEIVDRDYTHTLVAEECRERDTEELYGICRTQMKKKEQNLKQLKTCCMLLVTDSYLVIHKMNYLDGCFTV